MIQEIEDAIINYKRGHISLEDVIKVIDPMPDELDYVTGAPDASGEIYDQFLSQEYNHDLNEWKKRQSKAVQSKGGWTDEDLENAVQKGIEIGFEFTDPNYHSTGTPSLFEDEANAAKAEYIQTLKDFKTQQAIYKNYPNLNASKEEMNELRKLK